MPMGLCLLLEYSACREGVGGKARCNRWSERVRILEQENGGGKEDWGRGPLPQAQDSN